MTTTEDLRSSTSQPAGRGLEMTSGILAAARERKAAEGGSRCGRSARRWLPGGPTCTRRSRSTPQPRSPPAGCEHEEPIAGAGCPAVAEFCVAELGAVLGVSTTAAKRLKGHALELRHRLARLWSRSRAGGCRRGGRGWSPRPPSTPPRLLTAEAAGVGGRPGRRGGRAGRSGTAGPAGRGGDQAVRADRRRPVRSRRAARRSTTRHVTIDRDDAHFAGTLHVEAEIDIADALDLDRALAHGAAAQKALGSDAVAGRAPVPRPSATSQGRRPRSTSSPRARPLPRTSTDCRPHGRSSSTPTSTASTRRRDHESDHGRLEEGRRIDVHEQIEGCESAARSSPYRPTAVLTAPGASPDQLRDSSWDGFKVFEWCTRTGGTTLRRTPPGEVEGRPQPGRQTPATSPHCVGSTIASRPTPLGDTR